MPVDYSKWDALELSDDSDIEVHPNVDKKSFIRAKQAQIHQERAHRKQQIEIMKYERIINDGFLTRIDGLLTALKAHTSDTKSADAIVFQALIESSGENDDYPQPPKGVYEHEKDRPTSYSPIIATLVDQVKKHVDETKPDNRLDGYIKEIQVHKTKTLDLQQQLLAKLAELEKLEKGKITSESIHTGFNTSHVYKPTATSTTSSTTPSTSTSTSTKVELLNSPSASGPSDSGAEADIEDNPASSATPSSPHHADAHGHAFGAIPSSDYRASLQYISQHPSVLAERNTDGLLLSAFDSQIAQNADKARNFVHQALLLQYCRALGPDGVALFFKRITNREHNARKVFLDDVNATYARLRDRAVEMAREEQEAGEQGDVEQIQLHAVNPGQKIMISIPNAISEGGTDEHNIAARKAFESFPPNLQKALETGELDEVNKVLGRMGVEEAEEVVNAMGEFGMLSMEEGVIDATTEEGRLRVKEIEEMGRMPDAEEVEGEVEGEPGPGVEEMD